MFCRVRTERYPGYFPGHYPYPELLCVLYSTTFTSVPGNSASVFTTFIPVPGTSIKYVRPFDNTRGTGTTCLYLPGTAAGYVRPCHNSWNVCAFCETFLPVPGTSVSSALRLYPYPELLYVLQDCCAIPRVRVYLCHNSREPGTYSGLTPGVQRVCCALNMKI